MLENTRAQLDPWFDEFTVFDETGAVFVPKKLGQVIESADKTDNTLSQSNCEDRTTSSTR